MFNFMLQLNLRTNLQNIYIGGTRILSEVLIHIKYDTRERCHWMFFEIIKT